MNVLAMIPLYPPGSRVGSWLSTHEVLAHLAARGHRIDAHIALGDETYELDGVRVWPSCVSPRRFAREADIVISHLGDRGEGAAWAREYGIPSVRMIHGHVPDPLQRLGEHGGTALAVFNSMSLRDEFEWAGPSIVCPPIVWPQQYRTTPGERVTLINLSANKGGGTFWRAACDLPDIPFLGVRGGYERQLEYSAPNVELIGSTVNMPRDVYSRTRILLMPSIRETWGRVGVEAMSSGIPVIAHPTPGLRESLGDAGIFVDRDDHDGWCREIRRLQDPAEWAAASTRALARVAELDPAGDLERVCDAIEHVTHAPEELDPCPTSAS